MAWLRRESEFPHVSNWFKKSPDFSHQQPRDDDGSVVPSKLNLFRLFVERCYRLLRSNGAMGQVIPSTLWTGRGAQGLRKLLLSETEISGSVGFRNTKLIFDGIGEQEEFLVLTCRKSGVTVEFPATFMREEADELEMFPLNARTITREMIERVSPVWLKLPEITSAKDVDLLNLFSKYARLGGKDGSDWNLSLYQEINMSEVKRLVRASRSAHRVAVVQGDNIHQFVSNTRAESLSIDETAGRARILGKQADLSQHLRYQGYRVVHQRIARKNQQRTLSATVVPPLRFCADTVLTPREGLSALTNCYLVGVLNSFVADFQMRMRITSHLDKHFMDELPVPRLATADAAFAPIVERSAKLICTTPEFDELAKEAGLNPPDHTAGVVDPVGRAKLRAELDAMVGHLYGLTGEQFAHVLETFPLVDPAVRAAAMNEFTRMIDTGEAATFNPELAKPVVATVVDPAAATRELIAKGESATLEFKSTARWNVKIAQPDPKMERVIVKTIAAFLNAKGGTLIIGVEDDGKVYGLNEDYKLCGNKGRDGFENWLMQTLMKDFGKDAAAQLTVAFHQLGIADQANPGGADICVITVQPSPKPRFTTENGQELFYVRTGNATNQLKPSEMIDYIKQRWPEVAST